MHSQKAAKSAGHFPFIVQATQALLLHPSA